MNRVTDLNVSRRTVLILDSELSFAFWLGQALDQSGYNAFPAKSCEDATELLNQLNVRIDLLVVSYGLAGARDFASALHDSQSQLKVLVAMGDGEEVSDIFSAADAARKKPCPAVNESKIEWLRTIEGLFVDMRDVEPANRLKQARFDLDLVPSAREPGMCCICVEQDGRLL